MKNQKPSSKLTKSAPAAEKTENTKPTKARRSPPRASTRNLTPGARAGQMLGRARHGTKTYTFPPTTAPTAQPIPTKTHAALQSLEADVEHFDVCEAAERYLLSQVARGVSYADLDAALSRPPGTITQYSVDHQQSTTIKFSAAHHESAAIYRQQHREAVAGTEHLPNGERLRAALAFSASLFVSAKEMDNRARTLALRSKSIALERAETKRTSVEKSARKKADTATRRQQADATNRANEATAALQNAIAEADLICASLPEGLRAALYSSKAGTNFAMAVEHGNDSAATAFLKALTTEAKRLLAESVLMVGTKSSRTLDDGDRGHEHDAEYDDVVHEPEPSLSAPAPRIRISNVPGASKNFERGAETAPAKPTPRPPVQLDPNEVHPDELPLLDRVQSMNLSNLKRTNPPAFRKMLANIRSTRGVS